MSELPKFMLKPLRDGAGFGLSNPTIITPTMAGPPRGRVGTVGGVHRLSPRYRCTRQMYRYFINFINAYPAQWFLAYLVIDDIDHQWYECMITTQGEIPVTNLGDQIFTVQLDMVAMPIDRDVEGSKTIVKLYELTDGQIELYFKQLADLVNKDLPDAFGGLI